MQNPNPFLSKKLPTKISVRVLKQHYPSQVYPSPIQEPKNYPVCPPCHIETQKTIPENQNYYQRERTQQRSISRNRHRPRIFKNKGQRSKGSPSKLRGQERSMSLEKNGMFSPSFQSFEGSKTKNIGNNLSSNYAQDQTIKNNRQTPEVPTFKNLSSPDTDNDKPSIEISKNIIESSNLLSPKSSHYYSPEKPETVNRSSNQIKPISQEQHQKDRIIERIEKVEIAQSQYQKQIEQLNERVGKYYKKSQESQNIVLSELENSHNRLLHKQKQVQGQMHEIHRLKKYTTNQQQRLQQSRLQLQRSNRLEQLSIENEKLMYQLMKSQTKMTYDQTYDNYYNSNLRENKEFLSNPYAKSSLIHRSQTQTAKLYSPIKNNTFDMDCFMQQPRSNIFPNSISALYSPLAPGFQPDERNDTINQLLSPLSINPDFI